jgi:hypothetical protein
MACPATDKSLLLSVVHSLITSLVYEFSLKCNHTHFAIELFFFFIKDYLAVKEKYAKFLPHSAGRYAAKRFRKAQCPIVERVTNSLMMHGRNNGKKLMAVRILKHSFEIIHLLTGEVLNVKPETIPLFK